MNIKSSNAAWNILLNKIANNFKTLSTSKDADDVIIAASQLHTDLGTLPLALKVAGAPLALRKAITELRDSFYKTLVTKAEDLHTQALRLQGPAKKNVIILGEALLSGYDTGDNSELLKLHAKAIELKEGLTRLQSAAGKKQFMKIEEGYFKTLGNS